jgi:hypothetical protein
MKVGSLVHGRHDPAYTGIVVEIGPEAIDRGEFVRACRVQWLDGDETFEFIKMLEVISEG